MSNKKRIYLDSAATTSVDKKVLQAMIPYFTDDFGNASSIHSFGQDAEATILKSKDIISNFLNCDPSEIIFTSGASESNNTVLKGVFDDFNGHLITTMFEHPSVLEVAKYLSRRGVDVTFIKPEKNGIIDYNKVLDAIREDTKLVSIMYVNNEIGTIQPIAKIGKKINEINTNRKNKILFHTDAVQASYFLQMDVKRLYCDFLSMSSHKIYGPKGVGLLYVKKGIHLTPLIHGGHQENGQRAGTYNTPGIVGFAKAVEFILAKNHNIEISKITKLRDFMIKEVLKIKGVSLNGSLRDRLPNNANFLFKNVEGEALLLKLDLEGVACSTGSACASGSLSASHVLLSIGINPEDAHGSLRVSLNKNNTLSEIKIFITVLKKAVKDLRNFSPFK
ncbi:MAG: cysteine desulfurase family protein [Patescibacteria group bacterium]|nr:cysteine desulfurase family protein [Patescibacteria group bacterium]MDD4304422.1 cysteine desulfurase family protein [Patescibacteria group bacterium]MDD4695445.1 cysteine desulfurase family protein [Patescibacteria group bacterium]